VSDGLNSGLSGECTFGGGFSLHSRQSPIVCGDLLSFRSSKTSSRERWGHRSEGETEGDEVIEGNELVEIVDDSSR